MNKWRKFEEDCLNYLNKIYSNSNLIFIHCGMSNSTTSDIAVYKNNILLFFIETKMSEAQSGQFVLLDQGCSFAFSKENKSEENDFSKIILEHINSNYSSYKEVSSKSIPINLPQSISSSWIETNYKNKNVKYIITADDSDYILFPVHKYSEYFNISTNFRRKKSGSRALSKISLYDAKNLIENKFGECKIEWQGKKAYCIFPSCIPDKSKLYGNKFNYQLNLEKNNVYEIRMLSNTNNPNIIFSVQLMKRQHQNDLKIFEKDVQ